MDLLLDWGKQYRYKANHEFLTRYFIRVTINRQYAGKITEEKDIAVYLPELEPVSNQSIKLEVGIEDLLHIEFEYNKGNYSLKDCVIGKVHFLVVKLKIKKMEITVVRKEILGSGYIKI